MERAKLINARTKKHLSRKALGDRIGVDQNTIYRWEHGEQAPRGYNLEALCEELGATAEALGLEESTEGAQAGTKEIAAILKAEDIDHILQTFIALEEQGMDPQRRQLLQRCLGIMSTAFQASHSEPAIAIEEFLPQCANALKACWHLLHGKGLTIAPELLGTYVPTLMTLAFRPSHYQETVASLATQAKILQAVFSMHRSDLTAREMHCLEAVRCGRLADDPGILAAALMYQGYTYTYCLPRPKKAVPCYQEALQALGSEASLLRSDIYIGLADAYARLGDERKALETFALAQTHFPMHPEQDPRFLYADCRWPELYQWEGKVYLDLATHYPDRGYHQKAFDAFAQGAALQPERDLSISETLLNQAEAASGLGDLEHYTACLRDGAIKGIEAGSQKRYNEAYTIFQRTPKKWLNEKAMRDVATDVFQLPTGRTVLS